MSRVDAAAADRLPWLPDEPSPHRAKRRGAMLPWVGAGAVLVIGAALWIGVRTASPGYPQAPSHGQASTTVHLPAPRLGPQQVAIAPQPEVRPAPAPEVKPVIVREVRIISPHVLKPAPRGGSAAKSVSEQTQPAPAPAVVAPVVTAPEFVVPRPWNPRVFPGASGRLVQIGAFGTTHQAKLGWWFMVRAYPAVAHLPAVVRPSRNSKGRVFYRFQVGTTSQAHSEVLCQRMERIGFSCAVVGLPWKAKVER